MMGDVPGLLDATDRRMQGKAVAKSAVLRTRQTQMQKKTPTVGEQKGGSPAIPKSVSKAGEVGVSTPRQVKQADTMVKRNSRKMPGAAKGMC
jgi:hypothetical protein